MKNIIAALALVAVSGIAFAQAPTEAAKPATTNEVAAPTAAASTETTTVKKSAKTTKKSKKAHKDQAEKM
jgi:hypothetical protein